MGREEVYLIVAFVDFGAGFFSNPYTWSVLLLVMLQFAFAWYGYGRSHLPYILGKQVSIQEYCQRYDGRRLDHHLYSRFMCARSFFIITPAAVLV